MTLGRSRRAPQLTLGHVHPAPLRLAAFARPVTLGSVEIASHKHIIGLTGQGKSKLLASTFVQLHRQGIACGLIDPHADLALDCLALLIEQGQLATEARRRRLLYVDFSDQRAYVPFNVLAGPYDAHTIARNLVEACKRAWPALGDGQAPTFENILLHAAVVLIENGLPLTALPRLLTDRPVRERWLQRVRDPQVVSFFHDRYEQWGRDGALMRESTLNRVALLTFSPALRYSLGQAENALDFRAHLDQGTSVIYNLGGLDEATQRLLGCLLTVGYEVAALSRANLPEDARTPWHLILDEFSMFSAQSEQALARVLSLARKYGLVLTLAHQTWSQVSARLQGALQNTVSIAFKLGRADAEWAARHFGRFEEYQIKHAVADPRQLERTHPLFFSIPETFERWTQALEDLQPREAYLKRGQAAIKIRTLEVPRPQTTAQQLSEVVEHYRRQLLRPAEQVMEWVDTGSAHLLRAGHARRVVLR